jgi:C-terminal processing protease CtpA/Prc
LGTAYHALAASNKVIGVVLDLRFADGDDYAAAVATADLFVSKKMPVLDWGDGVVESNPGKEPIAGPLAVLVNGETSGAAETLAAVLRESGTALIIGGPTAGEAKRFKEFLLKNGERLRIATTPVRLGDESIISRLQPDITVTVSPKDESAYFADAYAPLSKPTADNHLKAATNSLLPLIARTSEADLVREKQKNGEDSGATAPPPSQGPQKPAIRDPALARALDLIKGLAITRESHL